MATRSVFPVRSRSSGRRANFRPQSLTSSSAEQREFASDLVVPLSVLVMDGERFGRELAQGPDRLD